MKIRPPLLVALISLLAACAPVIPGGATQEAVISAVAATEAPGVLVASRAATPSTGTVAPAVVASPTPTATSLLSPAAATPTSNPALPVGASAAELKYRLLDQFPDLFFCDPDFYPVGRSDEADRARQRFPELQADAAEFQAILEHNGLAGLTGFNDEQKLLIYREHKKLAALQFQPSGTAYQFQLLTGDEGSQGYLVTGTIDAGGSVSVLQRQPIIATCPICLAAFTLIDTPQGQVAVEALRPGDLVWTLDASGQRLAAPILRMARTVVPDLHRLVYLLLDDGRELWASPGHPTADGRRLADLQPGDLLDGARLTRSEAVSYGRPATYDLLPSGDTGYYWANGILMGSTLAASTLGPKDSLAGVAFIDMIGGQSGPAVGRPPGGERSMGSRR